jgi:hypothetical protein
MTFTYRYKRFNMRDCMVDDTSGLMMITREVAKDDVGCMWREKQTV